MPHTAAGATELPPGAVVRHCLVLLFHCRFAVTRHCLSLLFHCLVRETVSYTALHCLVTAFPLSRFPLPFVHPFSGLRFFSLPFSFGVHLSDTCSRCRWPLGRWSSSTGGCGTPARSGCRCVPAPHSRQQCIKDPKPELSDGYLIVLDSTAALLLHGRAVSACFLVCPARRGHVGATSYTCVPHPHDIFGRTGDAA